MKKPIVIVLVALILAVGGYFGVNFYIDQQVRTEAAKWVAQAPKNIKINYSGLRYSLTGKKLTLEEIGWRQLDQEQKELANIQLKNVVISDFDHDLLGQLFTDSLKGNEPGFKTVFAKLNAAQLSCNIPDKNVSYKALDLAINDYAISPALRESISLSPGSLDDGFTRAKIALSGVKFSLAKLRGIEIQADMAQGIIKADSLTMGPYDGAVIGQLSLDKLRAEEKGKAILSFDNFTLEGFNLADLNAASNTMAGNPKGVVEFFSALQLRKFRVAGLNALPPNDEGRVKLGELLLTSPAPLQLAEFTIKDLDITTKADESVTLALFQLRGLDAKNLMPFVEAVQEGGLDSWSQPPVKLQGLSLKDLAVRTPKGVVGLQGLEIANEYKPGDNFASKSQGELVGLKFPTSMADDPAANEIFTDLGYQDLIFGMKMLGEYDAAKKVGTVHDLSLSLQDGGTIKLSLAVGGIDPAELARLHANAAEAMNLAEKLTFISAELSYVDASLFNRLINMAAKKTNSTAQEIKAKAQQEINGAGAMLGDSEAARQHLATVATFIDNPQRLIISLKPDAPLTLDTLAKALMEQGPDPLMTMLNLKVTANAK